MKKIICWLAAGIFLSGCGSQEQSQKENQTSSTETQMKMARPQNQDLENKKHLLIKAGMDHLNKAEVAEAVKAFGEAIKIDPADTSAYFILAQTYLRLQNFEDAVNVLNSVIKIEPDNGLAYYLKSVASGASGKKQEAIEAAQKSVALFQEHRDEDNFKRALALLQGLSAPGQAANAAVPPENVNNVAEASSKKMSTTKDVVGN